MIIDLPFGHSLHPLEVDSTGLVTVIEPIEGDALIADELSASIRNPLVDTFLPPNSGKILRPDSTVAIVVDTLMGRTPTVILLEELLSVLQSFSIDPQDIAVIIGSQQRVPESLFDLISQHGCSVYQYSQESSAEYRHVGCTPTYNTPVELVPEFVYADLRIALGSITPDLLRAATGGPCSVVPGICSEKTRRKNLQLALNASLQPLAPSGSISRDVMEACEVADLNLIVNVVLDWRSQVIRVLVGEPRTTWNHGITILKNFAVTHINRRYDVAVVSAGGHPQDMTLYDAIDALYAGFVATRHDGVILLFADCEMGLGPEGFLYSETVESSRFIEGAEKSRFFDQVVESRQVLLCTSLPIPFDDVRFDHVVFSEATHLSELLAGRVEMDASIAVLPAGRETLPIFKGLI